MGMTISKSSAILRQHFFMEMIQNLCTMQSLFGNAWTNGLYKSAYVTKLTKNNTKPHI